MTSKKKQSNTPNKTKVVDASESTLQSNYNLYEDKNFMSASMRTYFRERLVEWKEEILRNSTDTIHHLQEDTRNLPDANDRASTETDRALELRTRDRQRKLLNKIEEALQKIKDGTYGYCAETDEPISIERLDARPIATLSIEAQEAHERAERIHRDFD